MLRKRVNRKEKKKGLPLGTAGVGAEAAMAPTAAARPTPAPAIARLGKSDGDDEGAISDVGPNHSMR